MAWIQNTFEISSECHPDPPIPGAQSKHSGISWRKSYASPQRPRRWTMPMKARPSQVISKTAPINPPMARIRRLNKPALEPVLDAAEISKMDTAENSNHRHEQPSYTPDSPAMILLRRATTNFPADEYLTDNKRKSSLSGRASQVGAMLFNPVRNSGTMREGLRKSSENQAITNRRRSASDVSKGNISLESDSALPVCDTAAAVACTEVNVSSAYNMRITS